MLLTDLKIVVQLRVVVLKLTAYQERVALVLILRAKSRLVNLKLRFLESANQC